MSDVAPVKRIWEFKKKKIGYRGTDGDGAVGKAEGRRRWNGLHSSKLTIISKYDIRHITCYH